MMCVMWMVILFCGEDLFKVEVIGRCKCGRWNGVIIVEVVEVGGWSKSEWIDEEVWDVVVVVVVFVVDNWLCVMRLVL